jgi:hypothetical protein
VFTVLQATAEPSRPSLSPRELEQPVRARYFVIISCWRHGCRLCSKRRCLSLGPSPVNVRQHHNKSMTQASSSLHILSYLSFRVAFGPSSVFRIKIVILIESRVATAANTRYSDGLYANMRFSPSPQGLQNPFPAPCLAMY